MILFAIGRCTKCAGLQTAKIYNAGRNNRAHSGTSGAGRVHFVQNRGSFLPLNLSTARQLLAEVRVIALARSRPASVFEFF